MSKKEELLNTQQIAHYLGVAPATIRWRIKYNKFPYIKFQSFYKFKKADVDKWVAKRTTQVNA